jgi:phosphatidylserine decarboxylase
VTDGLGARAFVALQYLLPQHALSGIVRRATRWRWRPFSQWLIRLFVRGYRPELGDALQPDPAQYASFNDFFIRELRADARPQPADAAVIASPVDGAISALGDCAAGRVYQAKGRDFSLQSLLAQRGDWARRFTDGRFMTIYLAPFNYHRIHMPLAGRLVDAWYVPGQLFSVNATTAAQVPNLFARNERIVTVFEGDQGVFAMVLVGALFVGSMSTVWHGEVVPRSRRAVFDLPLPAGDASLKRGAEMGRFNMGSTVILLLPPPWGEWAPQLASRSALRMGQAIGTVRAAAAAKPLMR